MNTKIFRNIFLSSMFKSFQIMFMSCFVGFVAFLTSDIAGVPTKHKILLAMLVTSLMFYASLFNILETFFKKSELKIFWVIVVITPLPIVYFFSYGTLWITLKSYIIKNIYRRYMFFPSSKVYVLPLATSRR